MLYAAKTMYKRLFSLACRIDQALNHSNRINALVYG